MLSCWLPVYNLGAPEITGGSQLQGFHLVSWDPAYHVITIGKSAPMPPTIPDLIIDDDSCSSQVCVINAVLVAHVTSTVIQFKHHTTASRDLRGRLWLGRSWCKPTGPGQPLLLCVRTIWYADTLEVGLLANDELGDDLIACDMQQLEIVQVFGVWQN